MWQYYSIGAAVILVVAVLYFLKHRRNKRINSIVDITRHETLRGNKVTGRHGWIYAKGEKTRATLETSLKISAAKAGGNAIIKFYWTEYPSGAIYKYRAEAEVVTVLATGKPTTRPNGKPRIDKPIFIDGSNLIYWSKTQNIDIRPLAELCNYLRVANISFLVYFDANIKYVLETAGKPMFPKQRDTNDLQALFDLFIHEIEVVPGGTQADNFILQRAAIENGLVISNDRYRDFDEEYPWIKNPNRVHRGGVSGGNLYIPTLKIKTAISG